MPDSPVETIDDASVGAGLDALDSPSTSDRQNRTLRFLSHAWPPIAVLVLVVVIWQSLWAAAFWPEYQLPAPAAVWTQIWDRVLSGEFFGFLWVSVHRAVIGFFIAVVAAIPLGLLIANFSLVRRGIGPIVSGLQSLPSVAWVPAAVLWFGLTDASIYFVVLLGAGRLASARYILLPAALPGFLSGLKQGWAFSWRSLMAAELIATSPQLGVGLGQFLHNGMSLSDMSMVMAAIILILFVGIGIELLVFRPLEKAVLRARGLGAL